MSMYDVDENSFPAITEELNERAIDAMQQTWNYIAKDCLVDGCGNIDGSLELGKEDVIELTLDAIRIVTYGVDDEAAKYAIWLKRFHPETWEAESDKAFPYESYGY